MLSHKKDEKTSFSSLSGTGTAAYVPTAELPKKIESGKKEGPAKEITQSDFFKSALRAVTPKDQEQELQALLENVLKGKKDEVKKILDANPKLVLYKGRAKDYVKREIEGTAFQMALGALDTNRVLVSNNQSTVDAKSHPQVLHTDEGIAEMIRGYFIKAFNNNVEAANNEIQIQQEEQFPGGLAAYENSPAVKEKKANDLKALHEVIEAVRVAEVRFLNAGYPYFLEKDSSLGIDKKCEAALEKFNEYLKPKDSTLIRSGKHVSVDLFVEALKLFEDEKRFKDFGGEYGDCGSKGAKNTLIWRRIIGTIQKYLPASYAYAVYTESNIYVVAVENRKLSRKEDSLFPFGDTWYRSATGYDCAIGTSFAYSPSRIKQSRFEQFSSLVSSKNKGLALIYSAAPLQSEPKLALSI